MWIKKLLGNFVQTTKQKASSSYLKSLEMFGIVEPVFEEELSENEWEEIKKLLDELDD